jgi:regulator of nonsense transcripts 1
MPKPVNALRVFPDIDEFERRHRAGTEAEFAANQQLVDEINKQDHQFQAWIVSKTRQTPKRLEYLAIVQPGPDGERKIPQQGEPARLRVVLNDKSFTRFWDARRIESPLPFMNIKTQSTGKLAAYQVTVHIADAHEGVRPLIDTPATPRNTSDTCAADNQSADGHSDGASTNGDSGIGDCNPDLNSEREAGMITLTDDNSIQVNFLLTASEATKNAELNALDQFCGRYKGNVSERQQKAFEYFVLLRNPDFFVDLHEQIPHLTSAMNDPSWPSSPLGKKFALLNPQQKDAYLHGFRKLHCGICILPGGPGAGKTHFNLFTIAMAQSRPLPRPVMIKGRLERRCPKVLFIVDMNCPVDDVANRMMRLYKELGMKKSIIRMKGWGAEVTTSDRLNAVEDAGSEELQVDFTNQFLRTANLMSLGPRSGRRSCEAPSLDEAAWLRYDEFKQTKYEELTQYLEGELWESSDIVPLRLRRLIYHLYRDTLAAADFIATTPVAASNHFRGMFKPDLLYFDESPHARELTNLIAIANFDPIAWIFCGDYRQTVPYVGSTGPDSDNLYRDQMQVSMMERAAVANVISHELLMNHRSFGGLHELASTMWYDGRMVSGNEGRTHPELAYVKQYLGTLAGRPCDVPRALIHLNNCGPERRDGTSAYNPSHTAFVMANVRALLNDPQFKGNILIMSPYKKAFNEYKNEIKKLPQWAQQRVEARTVDVAQGHEADIVFFDLVKEKSTKFLDDPNRLCVALTRARVGEVIMVHPNMPHSVTFNKNSRNLRRIYELCKQAGQVVHVDYDPETIHSLPMSRTTAFQDPSTAIDVVDDSASTLSASNVSVPHEPVDAQASEVCVDQLLTEKEGQPAFAQSLAGDETHLPHEISQDASIDESASPALPALSSVVEREPAREVAPIDDGELWWSIVMNRPAHGVRAKKEDETVEVQPPIGNAETSIDDDSTRVVAGNRQELATIVPSTATDAPTGLIHDITELALNEKTPAPPAPAVSAIPCAVESKPTPNLAPIDDGELWWSLVMNRPSFCPGGYWGRRGNTNARAVHN